MLWYLIKIRPFSGKVNNVLNIYNEAVLVVTFLSVYLMNVLYFSELVVRVWGWVLISLILLSLVATWFIAIPPVVREVVKLLASCLWGKTEPKKEEEETPESESSEEEYSDNETKYRNKTVPVKVNSQEVSDEHKVEENKVFPLRYMRQITAVETARNQEIIMYRKTAIEKRIKERTKKITKNASKKVFPIAEPYK